MTIAVQVELVRLGVQPPAFTPRNRPSKPHGVDVAAPGDAVLAVGRETWSYLPRARPGADLRRFLTEQRRPNQLPLPLQAVVLASIRRTQREVPEQAAQLVIGELTWYSGWSNQLALGVSNWTNSGASSSRWALGSCLCRVDGVAVEVFSCALPRPVGGQRRANSGVIVMLITVAIAHESRGASVRTGGSSRTER